MNIEETRRSWELERYFVVLPAFTDIYREIIYEYPDIKSKTVTRSYQSDKEEPLSKNQLAAFLKKHNILTYPE
jgi:hypothetical protein